MVRVQLALNENNQAAAGVLGDHCENSSDLKFRHSGVEMELRFWGVRGSVASSGPGTIGVGGNTTCVSLQYNEQLFIFDAGTGIRRLGLFLGDGERSVRRGNIFISHYHWDHIQGLPFFAPAFRDGNRFHIWAEPKEGVRLVETLAEQMQAPFFPVSIDTLKGFVTFNEIGSGSSLQFDDGITVRTQEMNHPNGALGFRLDAPEGSLCIVTDHEHPAGSLDADVVDFAQGATVLIHDAQYHPEEKNGPNAGWGHSSWEEAALMAKEAGVKKLYLSHHDPSRSDAEVYEIQSMARRIFANTEVATEYSVLDMRNELI
jgi:phosphoribosyl 1,2-cyclic phosphodiesterase